MKNDLKKRKWSLNCPCNLHKNSISRHLESLNCVIDKDRKTYDNFTFIEDLNLGIEENFIIIKVSTFFKNLDKPICTDFIFANWSNLFQYSSDFETRLSEFHLSIVTKFKMGFPKLKPKIIVRIKNCR